MHLLVASRHLNTFKSEWILLELLADMKDCGVKISLVINRVSAFIFRGNVGAFHPTFVIDRDPPTKLSSVVSFG
jgi:hypothetical protein